MDGTSCVGPHLKKKGSLKRDILRCLLCCTEKDDLSVFILEPRLISRGLFPFPHIHDQK